MRKTDDKNTLRHRLKGGCGKPLEFAGVSYLNFVHNMRHMGFKIASTYI